MKKDAVLITGGARRVGAATARYFARHGYDIALHYNTSGQDAKRVKASIEKLERNCELFKLDLMDTQGIPALMRDVKKKLPRTVALLNNASIFERASMLGTTEALYDRQLAVNLKAPFFLTQAFAKTFKEGCVINTLDTDIVTNQGSHFAYMLAKKALADFTVMAAKQLGPQIRVNGVSPGCMLPSVENENHYEKKMEAVVPLKRHPSLDELAEASRWLIEQERVTGQVIFVDGGKHVL